MIRALSAALLAFVCLTAITAAPAQARKVHPTVAYDNDGHIFGGMTSRAYRTQGYRAAMRGAERTERGAHRRGLRVRTAGAVAEGRGTVIGGRPSGCPHQY